MFRIYNRLTQDFTYNESPGTHCHSWYVVDEEGEIFRMDGASDENGQVFYTRRRNPTKFLDGITIKDGPQWIMQRATGVEDSEGYMIYEGDLILLAPQRAPECFRQIVFTEGTGFHAVGKCKDDSLSWWEFSKGIKDEYPELIIKSCIDPEEYLAS